MYKKQDDDDTGGKTMKREKVNQGEHYELQYEAGKVSPAPAAEAKAKKPAAASKRNKIEKKPGDQKR